MADFDVRMLEEWHAKWEVTYPDKVVSPSFATFTQLQCDHTLGYFASNYCLKCRSSMLTYSDNLYFERKTRNA